MCYAVYMTNTTATQTNFINTGIKAVTFLVFLLVVLLAGFAWGKHTYQPQHTTADVTVMSCSAWDSGATPTIPENTLTDACVDTTGTLHTAPTSINKTR